VEERSQGALEYLLMMVTTLGVMAGLVLMINWILSNWAVRISTNLEEAGNRIMGYLSGS